MAKKINLIIFSSSLHDPASVINTREPLFQALRDIVQLEINYPSTLVGNRPAVNKYFDGGIVPDAEDSLKTDSDTATVCLVATGGTEEIFRQYYEMLPRPVFLLSDGIHNSLAASLEIKTFLTRKGIGCHVFNTPMNYDAHFFEEMKDFIFNAEPGAASSVLLPEPIDELPKTAAKYFEKTRVGLIGGESSWLIASGIDKEIVTRTYGSTFVDIPIQELEEAYKAADASSKEISDKLTTMERFLSGERTVDDLREAAKMWSALKSICRKHELNALTIKCFDILDTCATTACLALSLLNDEGIVSGCEGDIPALWSMLYAKYVYGENAFLANPASTSREELTVDFAHCTIPTSMVHGFRLPSHFESGKGIALAGSVPGGRYRLVKISGESLDRIYLSEGNIIMNTNVPQRCRTQVRFRFDSEEEFDRFLDVSKGNHVVLCKASGPEVRQH